jgi:hypothetical protein
VLENRIGKGLDKVARIEEWFTEGMIVYAFQQAIAGVVRKMRIREQ